MAPDLSAIAAKYDALILDLWGVVHDGSQLYPGVHDAMVRLRGDGKKIIMLSNAPRRAQVVIDKLTELGVEPALYDGVMSSGEAGYRWLAEKTRWGKRYFYIGPAKDLNILDGLDYRRVETLGESDFLLNVGFGEDNKPVEDSLPLLREAHAKQLPMLCLNPDLEVVKITGERHPCAGAIAKEYEALNGEVTWFGKPYAEVYDYCMAVLNMPKNRVLAVGDSLETDIPGAQHFGIDSLLVTGGILKGKSEAQVRELAELRLLNPTYILPGLRF